MIQQFEDVKAFMRTCGQDVLTTPTAPTPKLAILRHALIKEEVRELTQDGFNADNYVEIADALADILYVVYGAYAAFGLEPSIVAPTFTASTGRLPTVQESRAWEYELNSLVSSIDESYSDNIEYQAQYLDAIIAIAYFIAKTLSIDLDRIFEEVHASNMSKFCDSLDACVVSINARKANPKTAAKYTCAVPVQVGDLFVIKRSDNGKVLKGMDFFEPNLPALLAKV